MTMIVDEALNLQLKHIAESARKATGATDVILIVSDGTQQLTGLASSTQGGSKKEIEDVQSRTWSALLTSAQAITQQFSGAQMRLQMITQAGKVVPITTQDIRSYEVRAG